MASSPGPAEPSIVSGAKPGFWSWVDGAARRRPFVTLFIVAVGANVAGSFFNIAYNNVLIIRFLTPAAQETFWNFLTPVYNAVLYPACLALCYFRLLRPLGNCLRELRAGRALPPDYLAKCRRTLVRLPTIVIGIALLGWLPSMIVFPLGICLRTGWSEAGFLWTHFLVATIISGLMVVMQLYFSMTWFISRSLFPIFFQDARPADVQGTNPLPFWARLILLWGTVAVVPMVALLAVTLNFTRTGGSMEDLRILAVAVFFVAGGSAGVIVLLSGDLLRTWLHAHAWATTEVARGNYDVRVKEQRHDEWGKLTDRFNDMAAGLGQARYTREMLGQFVGEDVREEILHDYPGLGGHVETITVMFVDIRGFTRRSTGQPPEETVRLLNQFSSVAWVAIEEEGGWLNKFLGDGVMALFGAPRRCTDHADRALCAAQALAAGIVRLNKELVAAGQAPLSIGVGLHTGPALLGCIGATRTLPDGRQEIRKEFTAIGESVNVATRIEQLTKTCGGPILISEQTRLALRTPAVLEDLGCHTVHGYERQVVVHRVVEHCDSNPNGLPPAARKAEHEETAAHQQVGEHRQPGAK